MDMGTNQVRERSTDHESVAKITNQTTISISLFRGSEGYNINDLWLYTPGAHSCTHRSFSTFSTNSLCCPWLMMEEELASETSRFDKNWAMEKNPTKEDYVGGMQTGCFIFFIDELAVRCS